MKVIAEKQECDNKTKMAAANQGKKMEEEGEEEEEEEEKFAATDLSI